MLKNNLQILSLEGIQIEATHGVYEQEKLNPHPFEIDLYLYADFSESMVSDLLEYTLNYEDIYAIIQSEMAIHSDLIEHISYRLAHKIKNSFSRISSLRLKLCKIAPPLQGKVSKTCFEITI